MVDLAKIPFDPSPNYSNGKTNTCEYLVIHAMAGTFVGSRSWFHNVKSKVSAHYLISAKGEIVQMVRDNQVAWHCYGLNSKALGIELEDHGQCLKGEWVTPELWKSLVDLVVALCKKHAIKVEKIVPHSEPWIQKLGSMGHSDPGPHFPMAKLRTEVAARLKA